MTKIKLCGLTRSYDIEYVNGLLPEYIGFVFAPKSRRYISAENAERLRIILDSRITPVGVFVD
ncbi:MAG: phosphoribosylanthranilate isomerase, partial [Oscillospiraceae bacterium]|nr:phosphoribosylanthranilate isomerase [Oscillospiraceae bacterium]